MAARSLRDRRHPEEKTGPDEAIALAIACLAVDRHKFNVPRRQDVGSMFVNASRACGKAAGQETYVILLRARHALEKPSRFSSASGSGTLSASNIQVQSKPCLRACVSPTPTARLLPVLVELRMIVAPPERSGLGSRPWTRCPRDGGVWPPRLPFARAQSLFDHQGVTGGVNMRQNPYRFVRREGPLHPNKTTTRGSPSIGARCARSSRPKGRGCRTSVAGDG